MKRLDGGALARVNPGTSRKAKAAANLEEGIIYV